MKTQWLIVINGHRFYGPVRTREEAKALAAKLGGKAEKR